jgi:DNA-binding Lrp family transcriptional regulator
MVTAIVLINAQTEMVSHVAEKLIELDGIKEVYSVAGRYDLVAIVRVSRNDELAKTIGDEARQLDGILKSETLIAFREFSRKDYEAGFDLGLD